ncbi:MAG: hypothetical protein NTW86_00145 [Candidatus Sumerlaeota bacterium]|nr:hypothetical protein [Candidatus Sumerlaeota bacterium]
MKAMFRPHDLILLLAILMSLAPSKWAAGDDLVIPKDLDLAKGEAYRGEYDAALNRLSGLLSQLRQETPEEKALSLLVRTHIAMVRVQQGSYDAAFNELKDNVDRLALEGDNLTSVTLGGVPVTVNFYTVDMAWMRRCRFEQGRFEECPAISRKILSRLVDCDRSLQSKEDAGKLSWQDRCTLHFTRVQAHYEKWHLENPDQRAEKMPRLTPSEARAIEKQKL